MPTVTWIGSSLFHCCSWRSSLHELDKRADIKGGVVPWHFVSSNDRSGLPRRACHHRQPYASLRLLLFFVCHLPLHRAEVAGWLERCYQYRDKLRDRGHAESGLLDDGCILVHLSCRLPLPLPRY